MTFGIREKISLLVICATATCAFLVAHGVAKRSQEVLREKELVDLGDEAQLRGWTLSDKVDGLAEDLMNLAFSLEFQNDVQANISAEGLKDTARAYCRRYWNDYLYIDIVQLVDGESKNKPIHSIVDMHEDNLWEPPADSIAGSQLYLSPIQRLNVVYPPEGENEARVVGEPVIWGWVPLNRSAVGYYDLETPPVQSYIRIAAKLGVPASARHFYVLENEKGEQLQRADELTPEGEGNDLVFQKKISQYSLLRSKIKQLKEDAEKGNQPRPRVQPLIMNEVDLDVPYYFMEGLPGEDLEAAINLASVNELINELRNRTQSLGRVGGLSGGVKEIRVLADSPEKLKQIKETAVELFKEKFEGEYDKIVWREEIECDRIHVWTVQILIGVGDNLDRYLIHYAAMEDELASSINYAFKDGFRKAFIFACGAGLLAFLIAMLFIRPLKVMTKTAQQITESKSENLAEELSSMISRLATRRRDEVGEISRASKRLFEEIIESQEQLEQRVTDRTADLRKANLDLEQANEQLMSLSHEKDAFVAKVSHDLRQPLNAIFLQVEALRLSELDDLQKDDVNKIHAHATRELNLVNDILEYQKIIMGAETLVRDTIDIDQLAKDLQEDYQPTATEKGIDFELDCADNMGHLVADERRLRQILGNLLSNACKFTKQGKVTLEIDPRKIREEDWIEFTVSDTGRGMNPDEQTKAFTPFVSNKKDNAGGTGLGLSICKELTERMGGRIGFVSELGKGTSFSVLFPRQAMSEHYEAPAEPVATHSTASSAQEAAEQIVLHTETSACGAGKRILVIDDDPTVRELLKRLLEGDGYEVLTAEDGNHGLAVARDERPNAITLDVVMPGEKDGWAVLEALKADPMTENIPVIMVSIMAKEDNGFALGVEDYLVKPVDVNRLSRVVSRVTREAPQQNLLIVDDDQDACESLARLLLESGWKSQFASNGLEALSVLEKTRPAAIVLDLVMPEMNGFEFLSKIQEDESLAQIPVIVMTGKEPTEAEREFLEERVGMILRKEETAVDSGSQRVLQTLSQRI